MSDHQQLPHYSAHEPLAAPSIYWAQLVRDFVWIMAGSVVSVGAAWVAAFWWLR